MLGMPGGVEWVIIGGVVLLLFGGSKLPKLGGAIGESIKNFKKGVKDTDPKSLEENKGDKSSKDADSSS